MLKNITGLYFVTLPWALKPLFGMLSIMYRSGDIANDIMLLQVSLDLSQLPFFELLKPAMANAWFFVFVVIGIVTTDLLFEAKY